MGMVIGMAKGICSWGHRAVFLGVRFLTCGPLSHTYRHDALHNMSSSEPLLL
jgi:hypothetical protein